MLTVSKLQATQVKQTCKCTHTNIFQNKLNRLLQAQHYLALRHTLTHAICAFEHYLFLNSMSHTLMHRRAHNVFLHLCLLLALSNMLKGRVTKYHMNPRDIGISNKPQNTTHCTLRWREVITAFRASEQVYSHPCTGKHTRNTRRAFIA